MGYRLLLILLSWLLASTAEAAPRIAKPGCKDHCGNVKIPYPFGIGPKCYHNPWYDVACYDNNSFLLKSLNVSINLQGLLDNDNPIGTQIKWSGERTLTMQYDCQGFCADKSNPGGRGPSYPTDLRDSPFLYSNTRNVLVVVGCGGAVILKTSLNESIAGCAEICDIGAEISMVKNCYGIGCCQTTIPSSLDYFWLDFTVRPGLKQPKNSRLCKWATYAILADRSWINDKVVDAEFSEFSSQYCPAPSVIEWKVTDLHIHSRSYANSTCVYDGGGYNCNCKASHYEGNPYLPYGCQVVRECENCVEDCVSRGINKFGCREKNNQTYVEAVDIRKNTGLIVGLGLGIGTALLLSLLCCYWLYAVVNKRRERRLKLQNFERNGGKILKQYLSSQDDDNNIEKARIFTSVELEKATDNFNNNRVLGKGGQSTVYKGMLCDGKIVAIKKFRIVDQNQLNDFVNEVTLLSRTNHRNIVNLLGCCLEMEVPHLVYEYVPNGSLYGYISSSSKDFVITWQMRLQIAIDIANAVAYMHSSAILPIFHRDIKSANILLDSKYRAKLSDFGISKSIDIDQTHTTTRVIGTFGYLDPEYFQSRQFTDKSDVYSFGVVLIELLTGQIANNSTLDERGLVPWFVTHVNSSSLFGILDAEVQKVNEMEEVMAVANLAKRCLILDGSRRPSMKEVEAALETIRSARHGWTASLPAMSNMDYDDDEIDLPVSTTDIVFEILSPSSTSSSHTIK